MSESDGYKIDLFQLLKVVWKRKFLFFFPIVLCLAFSVFYALTATPMFIGKATMLPHRSGNENSMANSLAMFYGASIAGTTYEDLIEEIVLSDTILDSLIGKKWTYMGTQDVPLLEVFSISVEDSLKADFALRNKLRYSSIFVSRDLMTGFMEIHVKVPRDPLLAAELANAIVYAVMGFNSRFHRTQASDRKRYLENRMAEIQSDLAVSELALTNFEKNNRNYYSSPDLKKKHNELKRPVEAHTAAWLEVRRQLEVALLDEHKGPPSLDVLDYARPPVLRASPKRKAIVFVGGLIGGFIGLFLVLGREYLVNRQSRKAPPAQ